MMNIVIICFYTGLPHPHFVYQGKDNVLFMFVFSLSTTVIGDKFILPTNGCLAMSGDICVVMGGEVTTGI